MLSDFRFRRSGVLGRMLGLSGSLALLLIAGCGSSNTVTIGPPTQLVFTTQPSSVAAGSSMAPAVTVSIEDAQGHVVTTATNPVTIAIGTNPSAGTLSGTATVTAAGGVATFSGLSINNAGTGYTLAASSTGLTAATSTAFNVVGAPAKLAFTVQPSTVAAGVSIAPAVAVSIEDSVGNVVPTATSQITIAVGTNPSSGVLGGTAVVNAVVGVATFSTLNLNKVGTGYTLTASATSLTSATSNAFNVTAGAAAKLVITTQPVNTTAGASIPAVQVTIEDSQSNVVTTATNQVTIAISTNPSSGTLSGTAQVNAVAGIATFSTLNINKPGTGYMLAASATSLTGATSSAFNVLVGAPAKLAVTVQPGNVAAGASIAPAVVVSVEDASGNVVPTAVNQVTIAIGTNPSAGTLSGTATVTAAGGVATFSGLSINNAGTGYTLAASSTGLTAATSAAFNVVGAPAKLAFTVQPSTVAAGVSIAPAVAVSVEDAQSNVVTSATNQITIAIGTNPASGTLSGTAVVTAVSGVATFTTLNINNIGTGYTLSASATTLTSATSNPFNVTAGCSTNCTISGTVSGPTIAGVTVALSGGPTSKPNTSTDGSGNYSFTGLAGGTYTVTPSLAGYTFNPATPPVVTATSTTTQNFTETSALTSISISGKITYAGSKTGNTIIRVIQSGCTGCGSIAGTSFVSAPSASGTSYTIRGLPTTNGSYTVTADIDTLGTGITNESNPEGASTAVTAPSADVTNLNFAVVDRTPSAPVTPNGVGVAPGNNTAVIQYKDAEDGNGQEIAASYNVYYGTDSNATNGVGSPKNFKAQGHGTDIFILKGLPNGATFFKVTAVNVNGESAASTPVSATLGLGSGLNTVSGAVTFPGSAAGHTLYVGAYGNNGIYFTAIASPVSPQAYSFSGVPSGTYQNFAILDLNDDGEVDAPDISDVTNHTNPPTIVVSGNTTGNITLTSATVMIGVPTSVQGFSSQPNSYGIGVQIDPGTKIPISMTLISGINVAVPFDMNADSHNANYQPIYNNSVSPTIGDQYQFQVTFSDGTTQIVTSQVTAVITSFAQNMTMNSPVAGTATVPVLNWTAPATPPTALPYTYSVSLFNNNGTSQEFWNYYGSGSGNGLPSSQTSVQYNVDGSASPNSPLVVGGSYSWTVFVQDNNNNTGAFTMTYVVP